VNEAGREDASGLRAGRGSRPRDGHGGAALPRRVGDVLTPALDRLAHGDEARAYAAWARAVGGPVAAGTKPRAFRRGLLTVECASSVWANELTYLGPQILRRMEEVAPGHPVERLRFIIGSPAAPGDGARAHPSVMGDDAERPRTSASSSPPAREQPGAPGGSADQIASAGGAAADPAGPPGQDSGRPAAKKENRSRPSRPDDREAAQTGVEGVRDERLRAAIEAALRRSSEGPPEGPVGDPRRE